MRRLTFTFGALAFAAMLVGCSEAATEVAAQQPSADTTLPSSSVNDAMLSCMREVGWDAEMEWSGAISYGSIPDEQTEVFQRDFEACVEQTGWGDLTRLTTEQIESLYAQEVETFECLREIGEEPAEPPTEQRYVDTFGTGEQYYAIEDVVATPEVVSACPPPTWFTNW